LAAYLAHVGIRNITSIGLTGRESATGIILNAPRFDSDSTY
jgi:hypothetical protein